MPNQPIKQINIYISDSFNARAFESDRPWAAISIASTPNDFPSLQTENRVGLLQLAFEDIRCDSDRCWDAILFDSTLADRIVNFIRELPQEVESLLVHCGAGISRSPAVAQILCQVSGTDTSLLEQHYAPNPEVLPILRWAFVGNFPTYIKFVYAAFFRGYDNEGVPRLFYVNQTLV